MEYKKLIKLVPYFICIFTVFLIASVSNLIKSIEYERDMYTIKNEYYDLTNDFLSSSKRLNRTFMSMYINGDVEKVEDLPPSLENFEDLSDFVKKNRMNGFTDKDLERITNLLTLYEEVNRMEYDYILSKNETRNDFVFDINKYNENSEIVRTELEVLEKSFDKNMDKILIKAEKETNFAICIVMIAEVLFIFSLSFYLFAYYKIVKEA